MPPDDTELVESTLPLPVRADDAHKGSCGRVLIVAGSRGMSGAAVLCGRGALRGGAGLVFLGVPDEIVNAASTAEASYLIVPLSTDPLTGRFASSSLDRLAKHVQAADVVAIGPGCGTDAAVAATLRSIYRDSKQPVVVDADALNALAGHSGMLSDHAGPRVLTPHPGEFARLLHTDVATVAHHRRELAVRFARSHGVVLLLKGAGTLITDGRRLAVNTTGNSGMATGGMGDVLTGLIAALIAQKMDPFDAARLGAHLHGLAGDIAAAELSKPGLIASDLPNSLCRAWVQLIREG